MPKVGLIGLGEMGKLYAGHLLKEYGKIDVFDIDRKRCESFAKLGARMCLSPREVAERSNVIVLALPSPSATEGALLGSDGILAAAKSGLIIADFSTVDPETSKKMAALARKKGVFYLDTPVSGGAPGGAGTAGARNATLTLMVGGEKKAFLKCKSVLKVLGKKFFYLGPSGSGSAVKLLSNLISGVGNLVLAEAFLLGAAAGFTPKVLLEVFDETDADNYFLKEYFAPRLLRRDFKPGFKVDLQYKDHRLAAEFAERLGAPAFFNNLALQIYETLRAANMGQKDLTAIASFWEGLTGVKFSKSGRR